MQWYHILYLSIYAVLILLYALVKVKKIYAIRVPTKVTLSVMFFVASVIAVVLNFSWLFVAMTIALFFGALGDIFLLVQSRQGFQLGVLSFGVCNALLIAVGFWRFGFNWYFIPIAVVCEIAHIVLQRKKFFDYGGMKLLLNIYMPLVGISGCVGISAVIAGVYGLPAILFGVGTMSFFVSDILLGLNKFALNKWYIDALNTVFYFSGVMLIATSMFV